MTVRDSVLDALKKNRHHYISGEELAAVLGVSRAAVSKAVRTLRTEGYSILSATNKGYMMPDNSSSLNAEAIRLALPAELRRIPLLIYDIIDSTNLQAKRLLLDQQCSHGSVVIAGQQTAGRGRLGRSFYSPENGLYMSLIIRPDFDMSRSGLVTIAAAAAVSEAIDEVCGCSSRIKWVNDIYLNGRKLCGILTEAAADFESGQIDSLIIGIGINTSSADFPDDLRDIAESVALDGDDKARLAALIISGVLRYTAQLSDDCVPDFLNTYRSRCMVTGRNITVYKGAYRKDPTIETGGIPAHAVGIDDSGGLIVRYDNGLSETITTGEVSIRL